MTKEQILVIDIENEDRQEATFMSSSFVNQSVKNRAYLNTLGAELISRYLVQNGVILPEGRNVHSVSKIIERTDISDILLDNIHIDVRVIFNEKQIFIPKSHFDLAITPDVYAIVKFDEEFNSGEFLGYILPSQIDKANQNNDYYFVEDSNLSDANTFCEFVKGFEKSAKQELSEDEMLRGKELSISLADHNISDAEYREFLELMFAAPSLRFDVLEFDNFETLSYNTISILEEKQETDMEDIAPQSIAEQEVSDDNIEDLEDQTLTEDIAPQSIAVQEVSDDNIEELEDQPLAEDIETESIAEQEVSDDNIEDLENQPLTEDIAPQSIAEQEVSDDNIEGLENQTLTENIETESGFDDFNFDTNFDGIDLPNDVILDNNEQQESQVESSEKVEQEEQEKEEKEEKNIINEAIKTVERPLETLSVDDVLDATIAAIDSQNPVEDIVATANTIIDAASVLEAAIETETDKTVEDVEDKKNVENKTAEKEVSEESNNDETASLDEIQLVNISDEVIDEVIEDNIEKQGKNLDKIDYKKTDIHSDVKELPDNLEDLSHFSNSKFEDNLLNESSGLYEAPTNLDDLDTVEQKVEEDFIADTAAFEDMDIVETENYENPKTETVDMCEMPEVDLLEGFGELPADENSGVELLDMDLSGSYVIDDDATSNFDDLGVDLIKNEDDEENFVDLEMGNSEIFDDDGLNNFEIAENIDASLSDEALSSAEGEFDKFDLEEDEDKKNKEMDFSKNADLEDEKELEFNENQLQDNYDNDETLGIEEEKEYSTLEIEDKSSINEDENIPFNDVVLDEDIIEQNDENKIEGNEGIFETVEDVSLEDLGEEIFDSDDEHDSMDFVAKDEEKEENLDLIQQGESSEEDEENRESQLAELEESTTQNNQEEWLEYSDFSEFQDMSDGVNELENVIVEEEVTTQKTFNTVENSTIISDTNFRVGEIQIDINKSSEEIELTDENIDELYSLGEESPTLLQNSGRVPSRSSAQKSLPLGLGVAGVLVTLALVGAIGFGVSKIVKPTSDDASQPVTDEPITSTDNGVNNPNTLNVNPDNVVNMEKSSVSSTTTPAQAVNSTTANSAQTQAGLPKATPTSFIEIKKLTWEVPDYVSYNPQFKQYLQSAGKSLKLAISSDLLLATDLIYSNSVRVSITFDKMGTFKSAVIVDSSGSTQVDKIVLQTVNQTLPSLKAPHSVGNDENTTAILKIYF